jgi:hypothetical protein
MEIVMKNNFNGIKNKVDIKELKEIKRETLDGIG